jgi:hypothetical protein
MICMLMHLLHGDHGDHASDAGPNIAPVTSHEPAPAGERELADLRAEVRWLRALVAQSTPASEPAGDAGPRVAAAGAQQAAYDGRP